LKSLLEAFSNNSRDGEGIAYAARHLFEQRICSSPAGKLDSKTLDYTELIEQFLAISCVIPYLLFCR
jgi:hypothetical protein